MYFDRFHEMNMYDGQEMQQREHEEEMRARLRRSESIEKAAVSVVWIRRFIVSEKERLHSYWL